LDGGPDWEGTERIAKDYGARFIGKTRNSGFAKTVNTGIRATAQCAVKILLNDDVYFETGACERLVAAFENPDIWVAGIRLLYPNGTIQHGGVSCDFWHRSVGKPADDPEAGQDRDDFSVTGALMGLSGKLLAKIEGLDETFGMSWEDADLCMQTNAFGKRVRYVGTAWAYHEEGGTRGRGEAEKASRSKNWSAWEAAGAKRFEEKWGPRADWKNTRLLEASPKPVKRRVVLRRAAAMGDVLLTTPFAKLMRQRHPTEELIVETLCSTIYRDNPYVDCVTSPKSAAGDVLYDLDLAYEREPSKSIRQAFMDVCQLVEPLESLRPIIYPRMEDRKWAAETMPNVVRWVVIHPGPSGWQGRDWAPEKFASLAASLRRNDTKVVVTGVATGHKLPCDIDLRGKTSLHQLAAIIERAALFIGLDSLPAHLAQASRRQLLLISGSIDPAHTMILDTKTQSVTADPKLVDCLACHHRLPPPVTSGTCVRHRVMCMEDLDTNTVLAAANKLLGFSA